MNDRITGKAFLISFVGHCLLLGMPIFSGANFQDRPQEDITVEIDIERPQLLPKIEQLGAEKKVKEIEELKDKPLPEPEFEPEIVENLPELVEPEAKQVVRIQAPRQIEERIKVADPDDEAMFRYQDMVKRKIQESRRYPSWAKQQEYEGISYLSFTLSASGKVKDVELVKSSGFSVLDEEAVSTVQRASPFTPIPAEFNCASLEMEVALVFKLE